MKANATLEELAATLYSDLPYHNFEHATSAAATGQKICRQCQDEEIQINPKVVYIALLFHDAGYHEDHLALGFTTKEEYSAHLARQYLSRRKYPKKFIDKVEQAILSTHKDATPVSNEDKAVRLADVANVGASYNAFIANSRRFYREVELLSGPISWEKFVEISNQVLGCYLKDNLVTSSADRRWLAQARENLARLNSSLADTSLPTP